MTRPRGGDRDRPLQTNAADRRQVAYAERKEREREEQFVASLRVVLETESGRRVFGELLERAGLYRSIWDPSAKIHFNEGRRNFGLEILAAVQDAGDDVYLLLEKEMREFKTKLARETAAVQQGTARNDGGDDGQHSS